MQIERGVLIQALSNSILCPKDMGIEVSTEGKTCGFSVDCKRCWNDAFNEVNNIEITGGTVECQK